MPTGKVWHGYCFDMSKQYYDPDVRATNRPDPTLKRRTPEERALRNAAFSAMYGGKGDVNPKRVNGTTERFEERALRDASTSLQRDSVEVQSIAFHEQQIEKYGAVLWSLALTKVLRDTRVELHDMKVKEAEKASRSWFGQGWSW